MPNESRTNFPGSFKKLWADFDTERNGYLKRKDFIPFFSVSSRQSESLS